ncbi:MAG: ferritin family protein, partial [Planctomycetota bacterium]
MAEFESYDEILDLAIAREEDANQFYLALAARVQRPEMRKVFEELAAEELEHKAKLELEVMKTGRVVTAMQDVDIGVERAIGFKKADLDMDYKDVLIIAMQKEESAFKLYVDLAGRVTNEDS